MAEEREEHHESKSRQGEQREVIASPAHRNRQDDDQDREDKG
jgi:hypothetical protein